MAKKQKKSIQLLEDKGWEIKSYSGADKIVQGEFKEIFQQITKVLLSFKIPLYEIMCEGGGKHPVNKRFSLLLDQILDKEVSFKSRIITTLNDETQVGSVDEALSHKVDFFYKGDEANLGLEIEWNSKVLAFERDIMNFRRLFFNASIGVGIIITRGESMDNKLLGISEKFFQSRIKKKNLVRSVNSIKTELSKHEDCNGKPLKFKTFTDTQKKQIDKLIIEGHAPSKAVAKNYFQNKWGGQTSHISSLEERIKRGGFQGIPLLLIGIPDKVIN